MTSLAVFIDTLEPIQYNTAPPVTGGIKKDLRKSRDRRWMEKTFSPINFELKMTKLPF